MTTTLNEIKKHKPCNSGWTTLLKSLGKTKADNKEIDLLYILESNGIKDAIWCLRCIKGEDKKIRLFAIACAREVQHLMTDKKSIHILDTAERFANGKATKKELLESVKWTPVIDDKSIINAADRVSYNTTVCTVCGEKYSSMSIGVAASHITSDAIDAIVDFTINNDYIVKQVKNEALERQKELFIQFFGKEKQMKKKYTIDNIFRLTLLILLALAMYGIYSKQF